MQLRWKVSGGRKDADCHVIRLLFLEVQGLILLAASGRIKLLNWGPLGGEGSGTIEIHILKYSQGQVLP